MRLLLNFCHPAIPLLVPMKVTLLVLYQFDSLSLHLLWTIVWLNVSHHLLLTLQNQETHQYQCIISLMSLYINNKRRDQQNFTHWSTAKLIFYKQLNILCPSPLGSRNPFLVKQNFFSQALKKPLLTNFEFSFDPSSRTPQ